MPRLHGVHLSAKDRATVDAEVAARLAELARHNKPLFDFLEDQRRSDERFEWCVVFGIGLAWAIVVASLMQLISGVGS